MFVSSAIVARCTGRLPTLCLFSLYALLITCSWCRLVSLPSWFNAGALGLAVCGLQDGVSLAFYWREQVMDGIG